VIPVHPSPASPHRAARPLLLALLLCALATGALARALEVRGLALSVADLDRSVAFYESALGFRKVSTTLVADADFDQLSGRFGARVRSATLALGDERIELEQFLAPAGRPLPADSRAHDLWFQHFAIVVRDMDAAHAHLQAHGVQPISLSPQTIPESNTAAAGIRAYKFRDPDGHPLELLYFPPGKGDARWQHPGSALFLGIDHSAITVADTERSKRFWVGLIGLQVAGGSLNTGPTQERLDATAGAEVRITGLRAARAGSPGLEFLQYLSPTGGREPTSPTRPNDIAHVRIVIEVEGLDALVEQLSQAGVAFVSPRPVQLGVSAMARGLIVRDPDGHAVMLVQR
jgi:catechol 2,3-dioxygenase-like lactoylglutathione lyase family enzyme